jgi:asparagine synthase (glutamine-hydrolysing)
VPLLSTELIEFAFSLPENLVYLNGQLKGLLRQAYRGILPDQIIERQKKGFSIPLREWSTSGNFPRFTTQPALVDKYFALKK